MAFPLSAKDLENEISSLLQTGVGGNVQDFLKWIRMEIQKKFKDEVILSEKDVAEILEKHKAEGNLVSGRFDAREYFLSDDSKFYKKVTSQDKFYILGRLDFSPMQYVKTRLEYFLRRNGVDEEEIIDIGIATVEAVENAAKYGDGSSVEVEYSIDRSKTFHISLLNNIKEFDLEEDIKRGKFSSTATLMRGMMVMQKLFNQVDLEILDDKKQASFKAKRILQSQ
ncbi:ATP-binding protein [Leptospira sp. GIMC2001]|uniref:ATP-binding protein n=1 Tax=Leptospira sp. GIMC2001 TaxID=1513297 RepID=UPI0023495809|nr:ATP-binding protein [Leptospira sp. GIMC2001]WCL50390.1 ATP-binding protein [Leptospira sp. GIMC2001]